MRNETLLRGCQTFFNRLISFQYEYILRKGGGFLQYDLIVLGGGPAGLAAAISARARGKTVLVVGNRWQDSPLAKAERIDNYLGLPGRTGYELLEEFQRHAEAAGVAFAVGRAISLMAWNGFSVNVGTELYQGGALVMAPGVVRQTKLPGEQEFLGRGVSYCATATGCCIAAGTLWSWAGRRTRRRKRSICRASAAA
jgi:thioredoxin reductase